MNNPKPPFKYLFPNKSQFEQLEGQENSTEKVKAKEALNRARARVQATKS